MRVVHRLVEFRVVARQVAHVDEVPHRHVELHLQGEWEAPAADDEAQGDAEAARQGLEGLGVGVSWGEGWGERSGALRTVLQRGVNVEDKRVATQLC